MRQQLHVMPVAGPGKTQPSAAATRQSGIIYGDWNREGKWKRGGSKMTGEKGRSEEMRNRLM